MTRTGKPAWRKPLSIGALTLLVVMTALAGSTATGKQDRADNESVQARFVGAWRLAWLEEPDAQGRVHRADCSGMLIYTRDGHMAVQVMYRSPQGGSVAAPTQYAQGGYEASFGTYEVDDGAGTFTYHVDGALVRTLVGKDFRRVFEFSGKQLIVKSPDPNEHWKVAWEPYEAVSAP